MSEPFLIVLTPDEATLRKMCGSDEDNPVYPLGEMPPRLRERLDELAQHVPFGASITLGRDWERCIFGLVEGSPLFDVLAFGEDGRVGHGGVNVPRMFDTVADLLALSGGL